MDSEENEEDGFVLGGDIGLRLKALEYWKCAETGLAVPTATTDDFSLKLVIAEALPNVSKCTKLFAFICKYNRFSISY